MKQELIIIYDGECPFCSNYVRLLQLKKNIGKIKIINARERQNQIVEDVKKQGYNLDIGMIAMFNNQIYHGADAVHFLSLNTSPITIFNKLNSWIFRSQLRSKILYPFLRFCRNTAVFVKGAGSIHDL